MPALQEWPQRLMEMMEEAIARHVSPEHTDFSRSIRHIHYPHENGRAHVEFRDGTAQDYDIVIIAEGVHSSSRELIAVSERVKSDPYALRYAWFSSPTNLGPYGAVFFTEGQVAVVHPPSDNNLLGFYFDKGTSEELQTTFEERIEARVKQPDGRNSTLDTKTSDVFELKEVHLDSYAAKNVAIIGDAAHGRAPTLGFGTSLALEDAVMLARVLNALENPSNKDIERALRFYSDVRMERVERVYRMQSWVTTFYTKSHLKVLILAFLTKLFLLDYLVDRMKKLVSVKIT